MSPRFACVTLLIGEHGINGAVGGIAGMAEGSRDLPIDVIALTPEARDVAGPHARHVRYATWRRAPRLQRLFRYRTITSAELPMYDVVFLRYPLSLDLDPFVLFRRKFFQKLVTVHHTNELRELWTSGHNAGMAARTLLEWGIGRRVLQRVDGIVGVTDEIRRFELGRIGRAKPSRAISNGVSVARVPFSKYVPFDGTTLRLALVASKISPWHGWDRLQRALQTYQGRVRVVVDAVGDFGQPVGVTEQHPRGEVRYHGLLGGEALSAILANANIGVSSLAMHRTGLREGCVLKTREYTARGLPFLYGYQDPDLRPTDPFCLQLPGGETSLKLDPILDFAADTARLPEEIARASRRAAEERMDWAVKMQEFEAFARELTDARQ